MVLSTHAIAGGAVASFFPAQPMTAFAVGFMSHFILDAIPHWHYHVGSITKGEENPLDRDMLFNEHFPIDIVKIALDGFLGLFVVFFFIGATEPYLLSVTLIGACAGMLPDALQFAYWKWRHEPLVTLQRFHLWVHTKMDLDNERLWGPASQAALALIFIALTK